MRVRKRHDRIAKPVMIVALLPVLCMLLVSCARETAPNSDTAVTETNSPDQVFPANGSKNIDENQEGILSEEEIAGIDALSLPDVDITDHAYDGIAINEANFPDTIFRMYVTDYFDENQDGRLSEEEIAQATVVDVSDVDIFTMKGIEFLTALTYLDCADNQEISELDVSNNPLLTELYCGKNKLAVLDVSKNTKLYALDCSENQLKELDTRLNTELSVLGCAGNHLTELDVSKNIDLTELYCQQNKLTALDIGKNIDLNWLFCYENQLSSLDISSNSALYALNCADNQLIKLDVRNNPRLDYLDCSNNNMASEAAVTGLNKSITTKFTFKTQN